MARIASLILVLAIATQALSCPFCGGCSKPAPVAPPCSLPPIYKPAPLPTFLPPPVPSCLAPPPPPPAMPQYVFAAPPPPPPAAFCLPPPPPPCAVPKLTLPLKLKCKPVLDLAALKAKILAKKEKLFGLKCECVPSCA